MVGLTARQSGRFLKDWRQRHGRRWGLWVPLRQHLSSVLFEMFVDTSLGKRAWLCFRGFRGSGSITRKRDQGLSSIVRLRTPCKAGDLVKFIEHPYGFEPDVLESMESAIGELGIEVASWKTVMNGFNEGRVNAALSVAQNEGCKYLVIDLVRLLMQTDWGIHASVNIDSCTLQELELSDTDTDLSGVQFSNSFFGRVEVNPWI